MIKSKAFNNVDDKILPSLKRDEVAFFVNAGNAMDPVTGLMLYPTTHVPSKDSIYDKAQDKFVDIAYLTSPYVEGQRVPMGTIFFEPQTKGLLALKGSSAADVNLFQYLSLSNYNGSNPDRDSNRPVLFMRFDQQKKLEDTMAAAKTENAQNTWALEAPVEELVAALKERNLDLAGLPENSIRNAAMAQARKKPFEIPVKKETKTVLPHADELQGLINEAVDASLIKWDGSAAQTLRNTSTGTEYRVEGISQTDRKEVKAEKLFEAAKKDKKLAELILKELSE